MVIQIKYPNPLKAAEFILRENRFLAQVVLNGKEVAAHVPSSGRMKELLYPGAGVYLLSQKGAHRKTAFDLVIATAADGTLVSVDSFLPNRLVYHNLKGGLLAKLTEDGQIRREVSYGNSRFDFWLRKNQEECFMEVKSVTLVEGGQALFPDAPTSRGTRHLEELIIARKEGYRAIVLFIVQREDAKVFTPHLTADLCFGETLAKAQDSGVEIYAYDCKVTLEGISLRGQIPLAI